MSEEPQVPLDPEQIVASQEGIEPAAKAEEQRLTAAGKKEISAAVSMTLENVSDAKDINARETYAFRLFVVAVAWIIGVFVVILCQGFLSHGLKPIFSLSDTVLIAFIGGTTVNVLGLLAIVVRYLFHRG